MDTEFKPTLFDTQVQSHNLQMMKTMIPYLNPSRQRPFALLVKYLELQKTAQMFSQNSMVIQSVSADSPQERMYQMMTDLCEQCSDVERENIESLLNMLQFMSAYDIMFSERNPSAS